MARVLTGIQSTGTPHLGNLLGAILPAIEMAKDQQNDSFLFIANLHTLTQIKDPEVMRENTYSTAAVWLACGLDPEKTTFYRQSDVAEVSELMGTGYFCNPLNTCAFTRAHPITGQAKVVL